MLWNLISAISRDPQNKAKIKQQQKTPFYLYGI